MSILLAWQQYHYSLDCFGKYIESSLFYNDGSAIYIQLEVSYMSSGRAFVFLDVHLRAVYNEVNIVEKRLDSHSRKYFRKSFVTYILKMM